MQDLGDAIPQILEIKTRRIKHDLPCGHREFGDPSDVPDPEFVKEINEILKGVQTDLQFK